MDRAIQKYFSRHGEPEVIPALDTFRQCVVIPAWDELSELPLVLDSLREADNSQMAAKLVVVNYPPEASAVESLATVEYLQKRSETDKTLFYLYLPENPGGVGRARKAGMDSFLYSSAGSDLNECIIYSLDADSPVSKDYFTTVEAAFRADPALGGASLPFRHRVTDKRFAVEVEKYEKYLHRYVAKLAEAGSPYAVHAIGSALAVRLSAYLHCDGMRLRHAGEDFYFVMDLVKTGKFVDLPGEELVFPAGRASERTPFGTGAALRKLTSGERLNEVTDFAFAELKRLLQAVDGCGMSLEADEFLKIIPEKSSRFLKEEKFPQNWQKIAANTPKTPDAQVAAFHRWFDALRTLRLLHYLDEVK